MGYLHIDNLYKAQEILAFRECYALEKIHGTSAHIRYYEEGLSFFSGGEKHENFIALFDAEQLSLMFSAEVIPPCTVYGEAYGGKQQGMSKTYGKDLRFVVFDVRVGGAWLSVPQAQSITTGLGLEFVAWDLIPATLEAINAARDLPSTQAVRNGIVEPKIREGVVLRPPFEVMLNNGNRVISKHKRPEFSERKSTPEVDPAKRQIAEDAELIALEWVTPMRLNHVLDKLPGVKDLTMTGTVIKAMVEDVTREAEGEIMDNKVVRKAVGARAAKLYKDRIMSDFGTAYA